MHTAEIKFIVTGIAHTTGTAFITIGNADSPKSILDAVCRTAATKAGYEGASADGYGFLVGSSRRVQVVIDVDDYRKAMGMLDSKLFTELTGQKALDLNRELAILIAQNHAALALDAERSTQHDLSIRWVYINDDKKVCVEIAAEHEDRYIYGDFCLGSEEAGWRSTKGLELEQLARDMKLPVEEFWQIMTPILSKAVTQYLRENRFKPMLSSFTQEQVWAAALSFKNCFHALAQHEPDINGLTFVFNDQNRTVVCQAGCTTDTPNMVGLPAANSMETLTELENLDPDEILQCLDANRNQSGVSFPRSSRTVKTK